jgi:hypothetical protein
MSVFISQNLYLTTAIQPLTHCRIGIDNILSSANCTGSAVSGFPLSNAFIEQTYEFFKPSGTDSTVLIDLGSAQDVNYFGLVGRNMGSVRLESSTDNTTFATVLDVNDGANVITMGLFDTVNARYFKFTFFGSTQEIVKLNMGVTLDMPRPIYGGHTPINLNRATEYRNNVSEGGQFIGRTLKRSGFKGSFSWSNITAAWIRSYFEDFIFKARTENFFIAWRPATFPAEVGYCQTSSDISPTNQGVRDLMSVSITAQGYDVESGQ